MTNNNQLNDLLREAGEQITDDWYRQFSDVLEERGIGVDHDPFPLEAIKGIAQALADASGYHMVLKADVVEPIEGEPNMSRRVGYRDVATVAPMIFAETVPDSLVLLEHRTNTSILELLDSSFFGYETLSDDERLRRITDYTQRLIPADDISYPFALLTIAAIGEGTDCERLALFTLVPAELTAEVAERMRAAGYWLSDGSVDYELFTARPGTHFMISFNVHVLVALGLLEWTGQFRNNRKEYQLTERGKTAAGAAPLPMPSA